MNYWLIKSDPETYGWEELMKEKKTQWTGIRNYQARNNIKLMKKGDEVLFYHSNEGTHVVGIAKVVKEFYQDPTTKEAAWVCMDVSPVRKLKRAVGLQEMKGNSALKNLLLLRNGRLSVMPVTKPEFDVIIDLSNDLKNSK